MKKNSFISLNLTEFLGWHVGDGCISINKRYSEYTLTGDITEEYPFYKNIIVPTFNKLFKKHLKKPAVLREYSSVGVCGLYVFDKNFVSKLQQKFNLKSGKKINITIPNVLKTTKQKKCFLRGLFDTDGSIYFCKSNVKTKSFSLRTILHYKAKIKIATISKELINQVELMLRNLGFFPRLYAPRKQKIKENVMHALVLDIDQDTRKWIKEIGFNNIKHSTKIQIWKKFGFCPPHTTLQERNMILKERLNPLSFYPANRNLSLNQIKDVLQKKL